MKLYRMNVDGVIGCSPIEYKRRYTKRDNHGDTDKRLIDYCLNCTKKTCGGYCNDFKRYEASLRKADKDGKA